MPETTDELLAAELQRRRRRLHLAAEKAREAAEEHDAEVGIGVVPESGLMDDIRGEDIEHSYYLDGYATGLADALKIMRGES